MKATRIPELSRNQVVARDKSRCVRCAVPALPGEWHHRRSRSIRDEFTHSPANGILLCNACHRWVHANPFDARSHGWIVSRYADPQSERVEHALYGWIVLNHEGSYTPTEEESA